jgi:hypothetical protein
MLLTGVSLNAVSYAAVAEACLASGKHELATAMYQKAAQRLVSLEREREESEGGGKGGGRGGGGGGGEQTQQEDEQQRVLSNLEARLWRSWSHAQARILTYVDVC